MEDHINAYGFQWIVLLVTAFGFYSASYALFATNLISPALAFLYWPESTTSSHGFDIDEVTLTATVFGMVLFGHAADRWGRKFLYGVELVFVIVATLGIAQASTGLDNSMKVEGWIYFWRIVLGFGIGAEYPVTAIIAAEVSNSSLLMIEAGLKVLPEYPSEKFH
jgi:MFS transporter, PHS family, inorganic phosphate transporter